MAASLNLPFLSPLSFSPPIPVESHQSKLLEPMFSLIIFLTLSLISVSILIFSLHRRLKKTEHTTSDSIIECPLSKFVDKTKITHESKLTHLSNSLLFEILPSKSPKWVDPDTSGSSTVDSDCEKKKKKKKKRKKKVEEGVEGRSGKEKQEELVCLYPFTSSSSATQRKIKQHYDQLVKSHESNGLTLAQVGEFVNCLIEARNDLKHKSEIIQRKFTITKALLLKADRSSFDRLCQQIHKLELEQKRLEEDAFVYNWLQQQLKLSPAYKKMLEIGACMDLKAKSMELVESADAEFADISFEELLAQEKKDSFWQKKGKPRTCSG